MADSDKLFKAEIGMETVYNDGGASFTAIPLANTGKPKLVKKDSSVPVYSGSLAQQKKYYDPQVWEIPISFYLKGASGAGVASELGKLYRIFGLQQTIVGSTSVAYNPRDTGHESAGLKLNLNGVQYLTTGVRGDELTIPFKAGERCIPTGKVVGMYSAPTAVAYSAPTFADSAIVPPTVAAMALTIGGNTHVIPEFTLTLKNNINIIPSLNAAYPGINEIAMGVRGWGGNFLVERDSNNDIEYWTALVNSTELAVASTGFGTAGGNKFDVDFSNMQLTEVEPVSQYDREYYKVTFQINYNATLANEFSLKHI